MNDTASLPYLNDLGQPLGQPLPEWKTALRPGRDASLVGRFCRVEPLVPAVHAEALFAANALDASGRAWTYLPYGRFDSMAAYRAWLDSVCACDDPLFFAIVDAATGQAVGVASYLRIEPDVGCIEVGHLNFSPLLQRTPAATEAMFLMMEHAFALGYRRYEWKCDSLNAPSRAAAERLGFAYEGLFRQARIVRGRNRDTTWYAITDGDWPTLRTAFQQWLAPENFDAAGQQRQRLSDLTRKCRSTATDA